MQRTSACRRPVSFSAVWSAVGGPSCDPRGPANRTPPGAGGQHAPAKRLGGVLPHRGFPHCDGKHITYVGFDDAAKNQLLGQAACLLFPIEWDEPFGIVMVEAAAYGTPVVAFARGSVPEVVPTSLTGFRAEIWKK